MKNINGLKKNIYKCIDSSSNHSVNQSLSKVGIAACRLLLTARRKEWRKGWVGEGRGLTKTSHLPLLARKKKKKKKKKTTVSPF